MKGNPLARAGVPVDMSTPRSVAVAVSVVALFVSLLASFVSAAPDDPPPAQPPSYDLRLVSVYESSEPEFLFVIGRTAFPSVASLEEFLSTCPPGTTLTWSPGCILFGREPLLFSDSDMDSFRAFCEEHGIRFELVFSG
jgi:hypothetical protein